MVVKKIRGKFRMIICNVSSGEKKVDEENISEIISGRKSIDKLYISKLDCWAEKDTGEQVDIGEIDAIDSEINVNITGWYVEGWSDSPQIYIKTPPKELTLDVNDKHRLTKLRIKD